MVSVSSFQEWASFMSELSSCKRSDKPLIKKAETPERLVHHLEKQLLK